MGTSVYSDAPDVADARRVMQRSVPGADELAALRQRRAFREDPIDRVGVLDLDRAVQRRRAVAIDRVDVGAAFEQRVQNRRARVQLFCVRVEGRRPHEARRPGGWRLEVRQKRS